MPIILNILPNVFWMYKEPNSDISNINFKIEVKKQIEYNNIKTLIDLDDKVCTFWGKSGQYIPDIKSQIEKDEFAKLLAILKKTTDIIKNNYLDNKPIIITSYKNEYLEIGLAIWIYFFHINANVSFDNVIKLLSIKIIGNLVLSDTIKKFFALQNLNSK